MSIYKNQSSALLVGMEIGAATMETSVEVPQKMNNSAPL